MFKCEGSVKKFVVELVVALMIIVVPAIGDTIQHNYSQVCDVYEVGETTTTFIDPVGYLWEVNDVDYEVGETVKIYFHDSFTDFDRTDDIIKKIVKIKG